MKSTPEMKPISYGLIPLVLTVSFPHSRKCLFSPWLTQAIFSFISRGLKVGLKIDQAVKDQGMGITQDPGTAEGQRLHLTSSRQTEEIKCIL